MSYQLLQIRQERGHCYHPLHTPFSTLLWDLDVVRCSGRINNEAGRKKNWWQWRSFWISGAVMFREDAVNIVYVLLCCALSAVAWCFSLAPLVSFRDHLYLHLLLLCCVCECVRPHSWSLTLHTWLLLCETSFFLARLSVYSFIYGKPGNHCPCLGLLWQWGKAAQIYAWQQKLIRHQLTHANVCALNFF